MKHDLPFFWYYKSLHWMAVLLLPFSWLFGMCAAIRRWLYRSRVFKTYQFNVPVIIVGNITVGGTGKTPFVILLANFLRSQGFYPGIVSRGVGGKKHRIPYRVKPDDVAYEVGDEALMLAQNTHCPVVIGVDRVAAVRELLKQAHCNLVISDDGLQHYQLGREIEVIMVDGVRRLGNNCLLPAGPLRESQVRLHTADFVVIKGEQSRDEFTMCLEPIEWVSVRNPQQKMKLDEFPRGKIHAVAGIGHPERFFMTLKTAGFDLVTHIFPDHYHYQPCDLDFADSLPIVMTEKDAVKCSSFANERCWYLSITAKINAKLEQAIIKKLKTLGVCDEYEKNLAKYSCDMVDRVQRDNIC
ncbi:MAG: tetraacyldisaccharide 4'-kinase [Gammaproteobacteria bacterium]|nr:tetraacyldisaccharide 4'-kinase [Gammaproteobacteria bacterium]MCW5582820.1 tetraacyldisaccharide 4'-kinase [Gammaproteobacteria bacterium]